jgi:hypothetical protein
MVLDIFFLKEQSVLSSTVERSVKAKESVRLGDFIGLDLLRLSHSKHEGSFFLVVHRRFIFVVTDYVELSVF